MLACLLSAEIGGVPHSAQLTLHILWLKHLLCVWMRCDILHASIDAFSKLSSYKYFIILKVVRMRVGAEVGVCV